MNGELHEAITVAIIDQTWVYYEQNGDLAVAGSGLAADAILALPEMQALLAEADEVKRLRAERDAEMRLADQLASHLEWALRCVGSLPLALRATFDARMTEALAAHKEARRER